MDYNIALAKKSAEVAAATKSDATIFSSIISGIVVILTALHGFFLTRGLLKQLGSSDDGKISVAMLAGRAKSRLRHYPPM